MRKALSKAKVIQGVLFLRKKRLSSPFLEVFKSSRVVLVGDGGTSFLASDEGPVHLIYTPLIKGTGAIATI